MKDNFKHIAAGLLVACFVGIPAYLESNNLFAGIWSATLSGVIAGAIKEWCDHIYEWEWGWKDFGYTCLGTVAVTLFIILLHFGKG